MKFPLWGNCRDIILKQLHSINKLNLAAKVTVVSWDVVVSKRFLNWNSKFENKVESVILISYPSIPFSDWSDLIRLVQQTAAQPPLLLLISRFATVQSWISAAVINVLNALLDSSSHGVSIPMVRIQIGKVWIPIKMYEKSFIVSFPDKIIQQF